MSDQNKDADRIVRQEAGRYVAEYDQEAQELRLSWSGTQTFLNLAECYALINLLNGVLPLRAFERPAPESEIPPMNRTAYYLPEHLNARLEHLATESYHLFVNGRWTYSFRIPETLLQSYREFARLGNACSVVTAGEIAFYCVRRVKPGDWVTAGGSCVMGCVKRVARNGSWADVNWRTHSKRMQMRVLTIEHTITAGQWEITDLTRRNELESEARS